MPYDDEGFIKRTLLQIIEDYEQEAKDILEITDFSPSAILWQQMKVHALDSYYFETLLETAADQMSIQSAEGIFLDKHGELLGMERRGATKAQGYVDVTHSSFPFTLQQGTKFTSSLNTYLSDEETTIPEEVELTKTRTGESYDYFPSDIPYAEDVSRIVDSNNNPISSGYWTFDTTYNNNIYWIDSSSGVLIEDEIYTVSFDGSVTKKVEVSSVDSGLSANAKPGEITTCVTYPALTVTNSDGVSGAKDEEIDDNYRNRLLAAQRRNFTLDKVRSIALGINGVRSAKVYQNKGTDQTSVTSWESPSLGTDVTLDQYNPKYSQQFIPGDKVLSLGRIVLKGRAVNSPPPIRCGVKSNVGDTGFSQYFPDAVVTYEEEDLDPTLTGHQDIELTLKYNGLDKTKTYRFDLWLKPSEDGITGIDFSNNYWELRTTNEGYSRGTLYRETGGTWADQGTGVDLMFKTQFNGAAYTVVLAPDDGFGFDNLKDELEGMLDYVDGGGLSPIGIQYIITEPDEVSIDIKGIVYIDELVDFATVRDDVVSNVESYLESLNSGENVIYSRVEYEVMRHPNVWKQRELYIRRSDVGDWKQEDISILDDEIADLGARSIQRGIG